MREGEGERGWDLGHEALDLLDRDLCRVLRWACGLRPSLTGCIHRLVPESQLPQKIVNSLLTITNQSIKSTLLWGS